MMPAYLARLKWPIRVAARRAQPANLCLPRRRLAAWLASFALFAALADHFLPHPHAYLCEPTTTAILVSLAISAAVTAAQVGLEYLLASKQKTPGIDRGKLDDVRVSTMGFNEFIPKLWGKARVAPIWIWHTPIKHTAVTTPGQGGGKGPPRPPTPATTDHIYTTSLAGLLHDGIIYNGATRIWFDTDLVYSGDIVKLDALFFEAEFAQLAGGANIIACATCSNGQKVTGIGNGGTVTFKVTVATAGSFELSVTYTSTVDLTYKVSVNGGANVDLICAASGGAGVIAFQTMTVTLTAGTNTVVFSNAGAACPDMDGIQVAPALAFSGGLDRRRFSGLIDPSKIAPKDPNVFWPFQNDRLVPTTSGGFAGNTPVDRLSAALAKWGQPTIKIYRGTETQTPDSTIIADKGTGNVPAYRGKGLLIVDSLQLQNGRLPNVTAEVDQGTRDLQSIVTDIYRLCGVPATKLDLSALAGLVLGDTTAFNVGTYTNITWTGLVNATQSANGAITKSSGLKNTWDAYANSGNTIAAGTDAAIRFTASAGTFMVGFSTTQTPGSVSPNPYNQLLFAVLPNAFSVPDGSAKNAVQMSVGGSINTTDIGTWSPGDVFQVEIRDGIFYAYQNGSLLTGFTTPVPSYPLFPVWTAFTAPGNISAASFATGTNIGTRPTITNAGALVMTGTRQASALLGDLQTRFQFDMVNVDGKEKAVLRNRSSIDITIPFSDLRAHLDSEEMPAFDAEIPDMDPLLLPKRVDVNYSDPQLDYHSNVQSDMLLSGPEQDIQNISVSLVESADNIKKLAATLLNKAQMESRSFRFKTGPRYLHVHPGTIVSLQLPNATHTVRVTTARYQLPAGVCEFEAVRQAASVYAPTTTGSIGTGFQAPILPIVGQSEGIIIDGPLLRPEDAGDGTQPVVYVGACLRGAGVFEGAFFEQEYPIGSGNYQLLTALDKQANIGVTTNALPSVSDPSVWDRTSTLTVNFYSSTSLSSAVEQDMLANPTLNLMAVINPSTNLVEYVQFRDVSALTAAAPYKASFILSTFLRGRIGTDRNVGVHTSADKVALMDSAMKPRRLSLSDIGR